MKKLYLLTLILLMLFTCMLQVEAYVSVKGYYRSNGTYVAPYVRSNPNGLKYDNYSYTPSQGLYNSSYGTRGTTWNTPTYITDPDYYTGEQLYESGSSSYFPSSYTGSSYTAPTYTSSYTSNIENIVGGYKIGGLVTCTSGYYESNNECKLPPANSTAYGGSTFYCNSGYEKSGSSCVEKIYTYDYSSSYYSTANKNTSTNKINQDKCPEGQSKYIDKCVKTLENARYNGTSYTCNKGFVVNIAGDKCVGIDTFCKEKYGIGSYGDNGQCYCNAGQSLNTVTNKCTL